MIKLTLTQLYKSRSYGDYLSPKKYVEPFLLKINDYDSVKIYTESENSTNIDNLLVQVFLKSLNNYQLCINFCYDIGIKNPTWSIYTTIFSKKDGIFYPVDCYIKSFNSDDLIEYSVIDNLIDKLNYDDEFLKITKLIPISTITANLGLMIQLNSNASCSHINGVIKISNKLITKVYTNIFTKGEPITLLEFYNLLYKEIIEKNKKDITNQYFKMYLIKELLKKSHYGNY